MFALHVQEDEVEEQRPGVATGEAAHRPSRLCRDLPVNSHVDAATRPHVSTSPRSAPSALL